MLRSVVRAVKAYNTTSAHVARFSVSALARGADKNELPIPGFRAPGEIGTNWELATGNERYEYLKKLKGEEPWEDFKPIYLNAAGTKKNPSSFVALTPRDTSAALVRCFPADSHETVWLTLRPHRGVDRCPHCGNVFKYIKEDAHAHDH
ncbi:hypothetical protein BC829DRAFT_489659 [Chytridium lagenaria]|nr:hypothetical protein BC829DRAFT_489659 [Chytridium lagenaria]